MGLFESRVPQIHWIIMDYHHFPFKIAIVRYIFRHTHRISCETNMKKRHETPALGDSVIYDSRLLHCGGANVSSTRALLYVTFRDESLASN